MGEGQGLCDASTKSIALNTVMMGGGGFWWRVKKCSKLRDTIYGRALNKASSQVAVEQLFKWNIPNHIALHSAFTSLIITNNLDLARKFVCAYCLRIANRLYVCFSFHSNNLEEIFFSRHHHC